jgi:purine catabolism regulator
MRLGRALNGPGRVTAFEDLGPYCFVLGRPTEEIRAFCRAVLGPLAESAQHDELRTLEEFLRAHGSVNGVARALFLHRNTVRQRLKRIGALTGADLEDADQRVQLYLAVLGQNALRELAS